MLTAPFYGRVLVHGARRLKMNPFKMLAKFVRLSTELMIRRYPILLLLPILLTPYIQQLTAQTETRPFVHNGYGRPYIIHRPLHPVEHPAVVFMLGGIGSTAKTTSEEFNWISESDRNGFLVVFPEPVPTQTEQLPDRRNNITFWEMKGSRTHLLVPGALPVDDEGYLLAVVHDVLQRDHADRKRVFFAGFSSGSGAVQLLASRHPRDIRGIVAVATALMDPPPKLSLPVPVLYIHGDNDEQFSGFEVNSPNFATTPHGNWVTWGYLNGCHIQTARKMDWGVQLSWQQCKNDVPVMADFVANFGHEWAGSLDPSGNKSHQQSGLDFTDMAWQFFAALHSK
jgi:polyhydroxybutyrate depolymerase